MREAGVIAEIGMRTAIEAIEAGARECDVAAKIYGAQIAGTPQFGSGVLTGIAMPSGRKTSAPHLYWSDDVIEHGHATNVELGGCRHQYHVGLARTIFLGQPPAALTDMASVVIDGLHAALASVRPGVTCESIEAAWRTVIQRAGFEKVSRIGYSIGANFQPSWVERTASLQAGDRTVLEPNMTFHLICGMWKGAHNMVTSETFLVTRDGFELFSGLEQRLFTKD
jgi:ectoine hydrolase